MRRRDFLQAGLVGAGATLGIKGAAVAQEAEPFCPDPPAENPECCCAGEPFDQRFGEPLELDPINPLLETWQEPWVWRPSAWPGQQLDLNVVENENPGAAVTLGNPNAILFSYGANTPGPTVRMKGDEILHVKLRNLLGPDTGKTFVGPYPDPAPGGRPPGLTVDQINAAATKLGNDRNDFCLGEHTNGVHAVRVTNLHTHGLHVRPSRNPNGTHSDNVILRVMSQADFAQREAIAEKAPCDFMENPEEIYFFRDDEQVGEASYEFRLGDVQRRLRRQQNARRAARGLPPLPPQAHPAGTFWYHPHCHGATWDQVSSGMAGFLIVEGDVDEAINRALVGDPSPDPEVKSGDYDYRERLMFFQRVLFSNRSKDPNSESQGVRAGATPLTNGDNDPAVINMRPGAVERWRVINGSVDGRGFKRFMVVRGMYVVRGRNLHRVDDLKSEQVPNFTTGSRSTLVDGTVNPEPVDPVLGIEELEERKQDLAQLSVDGVTLIEEVDGGSRASCKDERPISCFEGREYRYKIKKLSEVGSSKRSPLSEPDEAFAQRLTRRVREECGIRGALGKPAEQAIGWLSRFENVWKASNNTGSKQNLRDTFLRPNEFYMGPANRTDVFFTAPKPQADGPDLTYTIQQDGSVCPPSEAMTGKTYRFDVYTVLAKAVVVHSDTPMQAKQQVLKSNGRSVPPVPFPEDVVLAHIFVDRDDPVARYDDPVFSRALPALQEVPVQEYLYPVSDCELEVCGEEAKQRDVEPGLKRTRVVTYSGWGNADFPLVSNYPTDPSRQELSEFVGQHPELKNLVWADHGEGPSRRRRGGRESYQVLLPPNIRTMAIRFDNARIAEERKAGEKAKINPFSLKHPDLPRKFSPSDPYRARMLEDTAEEWALYNLTDMLWGNTTENRKTADDPVGENNDPRSKDYKQPPTQFREHYVSHAISRAHGSNRYLDNLDFQVVTKGIDHPFHIHQNPFWVTRIEVPDDEGNLHNVLDEPRWMDTIWIPRHRGRVVFRSRFPDFVGAYVHHCHILLHEDNGMMHVIEATPFEDQPNYRAQADVVTPDMDGEEVSEIYHRVGRREAFVESTRFFDPSPGTGQVYPGFDITPPSLDDGGDY